MADDTKKPKAFEAAQPKIPGVPERTVKKREPNGANIPRVPYLWAGGGGAILLLVIVLLWWAHGAAGGNVAPVAENSVASSAHPAPAQSSASPPVAPGPIATIAEMKRPWSIKKFVYRRTNGETLPGLLLHLPEGAYWAISLHEPYESCDLEFVSVETLRTDYHLDASYPMIADPCTHAVFDLTQYGSGPNGLVRGAIVEGTAVRPPLAIEVEVKGQEIIASRAESR
ncbi:MAG TPA: hypothetical protein VKS20_13420 [Candidatus Acidoferrales bacterium]|nr:hypothetical protein [Candidatus Acidoferrales bacterium]